MSLAEAASVGCWLVTAPPLKGQAWHLRLDSAGWRADSVVSLRHAMSIEAGRQFGGGGLWHKSLRYADSIEVTFGMAPPGEFMLRLAPSGGGLGGSAWRVWDVGPESLVGSAALTPTTCAT